MNNIVLFDLVNQVDYKIVALYQKQSNVINTQVVSIDLISWKENNALEIVVIMVSGLVEVIVIDEKLMKDDAVKFSNSLVKYNSSYHLYNVSQIMNKLEYKQMDNQARFSDTQYESSMMMFGKRINNQLIVLNKAGKIMIYEQIRK